jgi:hypothetical protein
MEPTATLAEIARILRPGGLFAAYDRKSPPQAVGLEPRRAGGLAVA